MSALDRLRIYCLDRDQRGHIQPVEKHFGAAAEFVYDASWEPAALLESRPDLVLCVNDFPWEISRCLDAARKANIPSLLLQDGILEWRCQYDNPLFASGGGAPQHQPVLADKIACLGPTSARHIASWGNAARVEVSGMPKLDALLARETPEPRRPGRRLLVMTAKKPWHDDAQRAVIQRSLEDLKAHLERRPDLEIVWRVTRELPAALAVTNRLQRLETAELATVLAEVDAVITTPSTAILEAMLTRRPVAVLDYHNTPRFVPTAWTISAPGHLEPVLSELLDPPAAKWLFQQECLRDSLRCDGPSAPRVARLIEEMVSRGRESRRSEAPLRLPANLLGFHEPFADGPMPPLRELYPGPSVFSTDDVAALQVRLARLERDYRKLRRESPMVRLARRARAVFRSRGGSPS